LVAVEETGDEFEEEEEVGVVDLAVTVEVALVEAGAEGGDGSDGVVGRWRRCNSRRWRRC
jgi:hypothetical protein